MSWKSFSDIVGRRATAITSSTRQQIKVAQILASAESALKKHLGLIAQDIKPKMLKRGILTFVSPEAPALSELRLRENLIIQDINQAVGYTAVVRLAYNIEIIPNSQ
jgi:hypothetical protein